METVLLLNTAFEPLRVLSWEKAITLLFPGKVEIVKDHAREIKAVSKSIKRTAVIGLARLNQTYIFGRTTCF